MKRRTIYSALILTAGTIFSSTGLAAEPYRCGPPAATGGEVQIEVRSFGGYTPGLEWYYDGEAIPEGAIPWDRDAVDLFRVNLGWMRIRFCLDGYCAHGRGKLDTDGGWEYRGEFYNGALHGYGDYEGDYIAYRGCFDFGELNGPGTLSCLEGSPDLETSSYSGNFERNSIEGRQWPALCQ